MDTSLWISRSPNIEIGETRKKFFGKYSYKLVVKAPGGAAISDFSVSIDESIRSRESSIEKLPPYASWMRSRTQRRISGANVSLLTALRGIRESMPVKTRIGEPYVQFYAASEAILLDIADKLKTYPGCIISVYAPKSSPAEALLDSGAIISRKATVDYNHMILLKNGTYDPGVLILLNNYLVSLGDAVRVTISTVRRLNNKNGWLDGATVYANDPDISTMLSIICPGIVTKILRIATVD